MNEKAHWADKSWAGAAVLLAAVALVYANSIDNTFQYDDRHSIVANPHIRELSLPRLGEFFTRPELFSRDPDKAMYRPLVLVSLALNYALSGYAVESYHVLNIALHALCTVLVYHLLLLLGLSRRAGLWGGLIFALHPLASEPVNYISSRSETMAAAGVLGALVLFLMARRRNHGVLLACSLLSFAAGLAAKSTAIVLPALILLVEFDQGGAGRPQRLRRVAPYGAVALAYLVGIRGMLVHALGTAPVRSANLQLGTQAKALAYYLKLVAVPTGLSVDHPFTATPLVGARAVGTLEVALALALIGALLGWGWRYRHVDARVLLGLVWVLVCLSPTMVVPLNVMVNEHRLYLPLVGWVIAGTAVFSGGRMAGGRWQPALLALIVAVLAALTVERNRDWADAGSLWGAAARVAPGLVRPWVYMGNSARDHGTPALAVTYYRKALTLDPDNLAALGNLGNAYRDLGALDEAIRTYQKALEKHPEAGDVWYNLGRMQQQAGLADRAGASYRKVTPSSPHYHLALNNLGTLEEAAGRLDSALLYYHRAVALDPEYSDARSNLQRVRAVLLSRIQKQVQAGQYAGGEEQARKLLEVEPEQRDARFLLAVSLFLQGRYAESLEQNRLLVTEHPDFGEGQLQLANLLQALGRDAAAVAVYRRLERTGRQPRVRKMAGARRRALEEGMP